MNLDVHDPAAARSNRRSSRSRSSPIGFRWPSWSPLPCSTVPSLSAGRRRFERRLLELDSAKMLPFSPQVMLGFSGGVFGGGSNLVASPTPPVVGLPSNQPRFGEFKGRTDIDAIMYWSAETWGWGTRPSSTSPGRAKSADYEEQATLDRRAARSRRCLRPHAHSLQEIETRAARRPVGHGRARRRLQSRAGRGSASRSNCSTACGVWRPNAATTSMRSPITTGPVRAVRGAG